MAQKRMFSKDITENDAFLDMPLSSQALYFHLGMQADDDGFVTPNRIVRMLGAQIDDLKILISKKFLLEVEQGILVIKHWRINNFIRKDLYKETKHATLKQQMYIKKNGAYTFNNAEAAALPQGHYQVDSLFVNGSSTGRQRSIDKVSIDKVRKEKKKTGVFVPPTLLEATRYMLAKGHEIDAVAFVEHYGAVNWYRRKTKISNWKKCTGSWGRGLENPREVYNPFIRIIKDYLPPKREDWDTFEGATLKGVDIPGVITRLRMSIENEDTPFNTDVMALINHPTFFQYLADNPYDSNS